MAVIGLIHHKTDERHENSVSRRMASIDIFRIESFLQIKVLKRIATITCLPTHLRAFSYIFKLPYVGNVLQEIHIYPRVSGNVLYWNQLSVNSGEVSSNHLCS